MLLYTIWEFLAHYIAKGSLNPFAPLLFISHRVTDPPADEIRYQKGYMDLAFVAYYIILWSFVRQSVMIYIARPAALWFGIRKEAKINRFGEQTYALLYWGLNGL